jgi:hypothetical protein
MGGMCSGGAGSGGAGGGGACDLFACAFGCAFQNLECDLLTCTCI